MLVDSVLPRGVAPAFVGTPLAVVAFVFVLLLLFAVVVAVAVPFRCVLRRTGTACIPCRACGGIVVLSWGFVGIGNGVLVLRGRCLGFSGSSSAAATTRSLQAFGVVVVLVDAVLASAAAEPRGCRGGGGTPR